MEAVTKQKIATANMKQKDLKIKPQNQAKRLRPMNRHVSGVEETRKETMSCRREKKRSKMERQNREAD